MTRWTFTDRYALLFLVGTVMLAGILSQPRRYIWFSDASTAHESMSATPPAQALESVKERAASNALQSAGFITIDPKLSDTGTLQINVVSSETSDCAARGITSPDTDHKILYTSDGIIAVEEFNRPYSMRSVKSGLARLSLAVVGRGRGKTHLQSTAGRPPQSDCGGSAG
jgi:hypothetical protein